MATSLASRLHAAVALVCPIDGLAVGRADDRATWRIDFSASATDAQRAEAASVIGAFDVGAVEPYTISKVVIIRRLVSAGKFAPALAALKADAVLYELWSAVSELRSDDANARTLFAAVGADPDVILAKED